MGHGLKFPQGAPDAIGLVIEPLDTVFCRDNRPFDAADRARATLPLPQTLAGMIRHHMVELAGLRGGDLKGLWHKNHAGAWVARMAIRGPWPAFTSSSSSGPQLRDVLVPVPANVVRLGKSRRSPLQAMTPLVTPELRGWDTNGLLPYPLVVRGSDVDQPEPVAGFLNREGMAAYLRGMRLDEAAHIVAPERVYAVEPHTGIAKSRDTGTATPGMIYTAMHLRMAPACALYAEAGWADDKERDTRCEGPPLAELFPPQGLILRLGGEGRMVRVTPATELWRWPCDERGETCPKQFFTVLVSPALFTVRTEKSENRRRPWQPLACGRLVAAAIPKPLPVSGWDIAGASDEGGRGERPRPIRQAIPAGAVYFWERGANSDSTRSVRAHLQHYDRGSEAQAGWGVALRGVWGADLPEVPGEFRDEPDHHAVRHKEE